MSTNAEIILEGSYLYFQKDVNYSQENFKLINFPDTQSYHIYSEILSRIETGEFLKVMVRFEMNNHFQPTFVRIEKSLGNRYAQEVFKFDIPAQELKYTFQTSTGSQDFTRSLGAKHYLTSPAFATSAIFTLSKKFDATGRTVVALVNSQNDWTYEHPPEEKIIYAEFKTREVQDFKLNNTPLSASHLCLYEFDTSSPTVESPVEIFISKHYGIPYQLIHGDQKIVIKNLKKNG
ncbi:MAG: hypothetical protein H0V66_07690 [Bdellovibrionales bacterium]|nr:hypothetical protein [Bdellovibrionales bacterium]